MGLEENHMYVEMKNIYKQYGDLVKLDKKWIFFYKKAPKKGTP